MPSLRSKRGDFQGILKRVLVVYLKKRISEKVELKTQTIGGSSLVRELLSIYGGSLVMASGLLTGTPAPTGGRYSMGIKTDQGYHVSSIGGFIGAYIKGYGIDGIVITERSDEKLTLHFSPDGMSFSSASDLLGKSIFQVADLLEKKGQRSILVGPAGENGSNISSLISERFRSFGKGAGKVLFDMGVKAIVFSPARFNAENERFLREAMRIRKKLKAKNESVKRYGHPCYGCPISCIAMEGRLKKGVSRILRYHENAEKIVDMANDFGVDLFGAHLASKSCGCSIEEVIEMAKEGKSFNVMYPEHQPDDWKDYLDSLGICADASRFLQEEDIENLHRFFIERT